jgi:ubiquitin-like domain-containing CTD phosphatase 1
LGLKTRDGKLAGDDALVGDLALKASTKIMMMGQREEVGLGEWGCRSG